MFYGDTISFIGDYAIDQGMISEYLLWDILAQMQCPTGHAVLPLPVSEFFRTPSADEIIEAQKLGHRVEAAARRLFPFVEFSHSYDFARTIVSAGKSVFDNAINGLQDAGVNTKDPVQLLFVLKKLGPKRFEEAFGMGEEDSSYPGKRKPIMPTDVSFMSKDCIDRNRPLFTTAVAKNNLSGRRILLSSTDVHEHAIIILESLLRDAGAEVVYLGAERDTADIMREITQNDIDAVLISTHNGMALDYAKRLRKELDACSIKIPVIMGGVLNQKFENQVLPVDVSSQLLKLGFRISPKIGSNFTQLLEIPENDRLIQPITLTYMLPKERGVINRKVAFIGGGHITEIIIKAVSAKSALAADHMIVSDPDKNRRDHLQKTYGVVTTSSNPSAVSAADYVFVNVLPQVVDTVLDEFCQAAFPGNKAIISLAAGIPLDRYSCLGEDVPVIRALPNPPSQIGMGITAIAYNPNVTQEQIEEVSGLFSALGDYLFISESQINTVTALSTPAIVYLFFQSLVDAGVRAGIDSNTSTQIVSKTIFGAMEVWKRRSVSPQELLSEASTPGGISVECLFTLEKYAFRAALSEAISNGAAKAAAFSIPRTSK